MSALKCLFLKGNSGPGILQAIQEVHARTVSLGDCADRLSYKLLCKDKHMAEEDPPWNPVPV